MGHFCKAAFLCLLIGCSNNPDQAGKEISPNDWSTLFDKFGRSGVPGSDDSFYFAKSRPFDTCFVLIIKKQPDGIRGFYYETLPDYHNGLYDYMSRPEELL